MNSLTFNEVMHTLSWQDRAGLAQTVTLSRLTTRIAQLRHGSDCDFGGLLAQLAGELIAEEIPNAVTQPLTFACVWTDLARLAGVEPPAEVAALAYGDALTITTLGEELLAELATH